MLNPSRRRIAFSTLAAVTALAGSAPAIAAAVPAPTAPSPTIQPASSPTQGIIMRDGGVCDPIRHMGC